MSKYGETNSTKEVLLLMAKKIRAIRTEKRMTQESLSNKSGVAYASIRKFESTGLISFISLLKICKALGRLDEFESILQPDDLDRKRKLFDGN
ncbi:MAG: helix-turn-helix transcriptional regulator [Flavobacteriales bacterium]|nr:helix-turn-helix transcriptional regulator [Flavobacteriales bacterium]